MSGNPQQYSRDFLFLLQDSGMGTVNPLTAVPPEIVRLNPSIENRSWSSLSGTRRARKRGRRGGLRQGHRRIPLLTVIMANVKSLRSKVDELQSNVKYLEEYRDACILALTETWLKEQDPQSELEIDGFGVPFHLDRDPAVTGTSLSGVVCHHKNWCKTVIVRETLCTRDIELLSVSLRPFYLPREFTQLFITVHSGFAKNGTAANRG